MSNNLFPVSKNAWKCIGYSFIAIIIFSILSLHSLSILTFLLAVFLVYVFRNPERELPTFEANSILSPVDGVLTDIQELDNSEFAYKLSIESGFLDVGVLRSPMSASVVSVSLHKGTRLNAKSLLGSKINENASIVFQDANSNTVKVSHMLTQSFCSLELDKLQNKNITQSLRYGVMVNGITSIYLPQNFRLNIKLGENLKASESLIGYFS